MKKSKNKVIPWKHIRDEQPKDGEIIVQLDKPWENHYEGSDFTRHYCMGMRCYYQKVSWDEFVKDCAQMNVPLPDFWWVSARDFPFP